MESEKNPFNKLLNKMIVTKEGKRLGFLKDSTFDVNSGEVLNIITKDSTAYAKSLNLEKTPKNDILIPYNSVIAIGDFIIVSEEDLV